MEQQRKGTVVGGIVLVGVGVALLVGQFAGDSGGPLVLAGLGGGFLVAHGFTRTYGLLVPGGILTGLGLGTLAEQTGVTAVEPVLVGLGAGFLAVWAIDTFITRTGPPAGWWPLVPGGIVLFIGLAPLFGDDQRLVPLAIGLAFMAVGAVLVIRGMGKQRADEQTPEE